MPRILLTGFEPFGDRPTNSSAAVVARLAADPPPGVDLATAVLPVTFAGAWPALRAAVDRHAPDAVVALGQAAGRSRVEVERVGINLADADLPDNAGAQPVDEALLDDGPPAAFATLPVRAIVEAVRAAGVPAALSTTAGTYVCNALLYRAAVGLDVPVGFVHLPCLPEEAGGADLPTMAVEVAARGVAVALATVAEHLGR